MKPSQLVAIGLKCLTMVAQDSDIEVCVASKKMALKAIVTFNQETSSLN